MKFKVQIKFSIGFSEVLVQMRTRGTSSSSFHYYQKTKCLLLFLRFAATFVVEFR